MKFGRDFEGQMIQEWCEAYVDYRALKLILKQILRFRHRDPAFRRFPPTPPPPPPAPPSSTTASVNNSAGGGGGLTRRISLYRAFSGLTNRAKGSPRKRDKHNHHHNHHYHLFDDEEEQVILITEDETANYTTTFLNSVDDGGELEVMFFRRLDGEFNKVVRFYKQKVEEVMEEADELSRQLNVLIALRIKVENPMANLPDINGIHSSPVSPEHQSNRVPDTSPMATIKEQEQGEEETSVDGNRNKGFKPAPLEMLDNVKINIKPETPLTMLKCMISSLTSKQTFSKSELRTAEELMSRAFVEFYQKLRCLKSRRPKPR